MRRHLCAKGVVQVGANVSYFVGGTSSCTGRRLSRYKFGHITKKPHDESAKVPPFGKRLPREDDGVRRGEDGR